MKTTIRTIILAAAVIFAAMSCQKEAAVPGTQDQPKTGETIQVNINASLGDLVAADGTKATAESVIRLKWEGTETVQVYCGTTKISTDGLTVTPSENGLFAKLTGEITTTGLTSGTSVITFVYSNVNNSAATNEAPTFDFSSQDANIPFVAYATLVYDGTAALTDKMVEFKFATSVMKIAATNLGGGTISTATISGINTKVTLTPNATVSETFGISGDVKGDITKTDGIEAPSDGTRAIITVGLVPDSYKGRNITITQSNFTNKGVITYAEIKSNTSYTTPTALFPCGKNGSRGYVLIAGTKWATQNLAVSASGKGNWTPDGSLTVNVPGTATDEKVQIGDYFQWAAYKDYTKEENEDKGLLVYKDFTFDVSSGFSSTTWKKYSESMDYSFYIGYAPYYNEGNTKYTKYTIDDGIVTLTPSDDVASIFWEGSWRMPTYAEFQALKNATYWEWDSTDKGYYVYAPQSGDAGCFNGKDIFMQPVVSGTYEKSSALLFFPATGLGGGPIISSYGSLGFYWSSSLCTELNMDNTAYRLSFEAFMPNILSNDRINGYSVRPVSD